MKRDERQVERDERQVERDGKRQVKRDEKRKVKREKIEDRTKKENQYHVEDGHSI